MSTRFHVSSSNFLKLTAASTSLPSVNRTFLSIFTMSLLYASVTIVFLKDHSIIPGTIGVSSTSGTGGITIVGVGCGDG